MKVIYTDGSVLECNTIQIDYNAIYCDLVYTVHIDEIDHIED